jgi:hypothetical protein
LFEQMLIRFLAGGVAVSLLSVFGDILKPKSFAGLFGAAPSIALATLALTISTNGSLYAGIESRSMIAGGIAFFAYASATSHVLCRWRFRVLPVTAGFLAGWLGIALSIWGISLR